MNPTRVDVLGLPVDALDVEGLLARVAELVTARRAARVAYLNAHVLDVALRHDEVAAFLKRADVVYCDGEGIRVAAGLLGHSLPTRMTGADWIHDLAARAAHEGWRIAWIGGRPGVCARACEVLRAAHPSLDLLPEHGFHDDEEALLARVAEWSPDIVLLGMGTPTQERFVLRNAARLQAPVTWVVGAVADVVSGDVPRGPRWLYTRQEWLARLLVDPRRLWRRYLIGNARVAVKVLRARGRR